MHILSAGPSLLIDVAERKDPVKSNANQQPIIINYCKPRANQNWLKSTADKNWQKHFTLENTFTLLKTCLSEVSPCAAAVSVDFCSCFKCEPFNFDFDLISHSIEHCRALRKSYFLKAGKLNIWPVAWDKSQLWTCEQGLCRAHPGGNILSEIRHNVIDLWPI